MNLVQISATPRATEDHKLFTKIWIHVIKTHHNQHRQQRGDKTIANRQGSPGHQHLLQLTLTLEKDIFDRSWTPEFLTMSLALYPWTVPTPLPQNSPLTVTLCSPVPGWVKRSTCMDTSPTGSSLDPWSESTPPVWGMDRKGARYPHITFLSSANIFHRR